MLWGIERFHCWLDNSMSTIAPREVPLGGLRAMTVRRTLPNRERTTIGAWCFIDHYGPNRVRPLLAGGDSVSLGTDDGTKPAHEGMFVAPHPHTGLQTVTWLFSGEVEHRDSVGSHQLITPGSVNLMTAGRGIQHSEVSATFDGWLHGVQLWVVLPDAHRHQLPFFEHFTAPRVTLGNAEVTVFVGSLGDIAAPPTTFSDLVGAELNMPAHTTIEVPYRSDFEYGILIDRGHASVNDEDVPPHHLAYVEPGAGNLTITAHEPTRLLLLGGVPFDESIVMWWNFIARSHDEIVAMREAWQGDVIDGTTGEGIFGQMSFDGPSIPAPEMPGVRLKSRAPRR